MNTEKLFSYGTLQYEAVQLANFGRKLEGNKDQLPGFELSMLEITDLDVIATSGEAFHPIAVAMDFSPQEEMGRLAVQALLNKLENQEQSH